MGSDPYLLPHMRRSSSSGNLQMSAAGSGLASSSIISYWQPRTVTKRQTDQVAPHPQSFSEARGRRNSQPQEEQDTGGEISPGLLRPVPGFYLFTRAWSMEGQWRDVFKRTWVKGSFEGPTKALKLTTYLFEENVTGHSVQMLQMDKALKGRRESWQPAV